MQGAIRPAGVMIETVFTWVKSLADTLRNSAHADRWIGQLPTGDAMAIQKDALELVAKFPGARKDVGAAQAEALLKIDARLEPIIAQLTHQCVTNYQKSSAVESRLWHSVFDLVKAFVAAYHASLMSGFPRAESKRWRVREAGRFAGAGVSEFAAADAARLRQLHARPGRVGGTPARGLDAVADVDAAARRRL